MPNVGHRFTLVFAFHANYASCRLTEGCWAHISPFSLPPFGFYFYFIDIFIYIRQGLLKVLGWHTTQWYLTMSKTFEMEGVPCLLQLKQYSEGLHKVTSLWTLKWFFTNINAYIIYFFKMIHRLWEIVRPFVHSYSHVTVSLTSCSVFVCFALLFFFKQSIVSSPMFQISQWAFPCFVSS